MRRKNLLLILLVASVLITTILNVRVVVTALVVYVGVKFAIRIINRGSIDSEEGVAKNSPQNQKTKKKERLSKEQLERFAIECNAYLEHQDEMEEYEKHFSKNRTEPEEKYETKEIGKKKHSEELERFARECEAYAERQEEMEEYERAFGIKSE